MISNFFVKNKKKSRLFKLVRVKNQNLIKSKFTIVNYWIINLNKIKFKYLKTCHTFHLVDPSPWPILGSFGAFMLTVGISLFMHNYFGGFNLFLTGIFTILYVMWIWWRDIIREATLEEQHSFIVQKGLRLGMVLFIVSEIMFFFAFFWAFFHSSLAPTFNIGGVWPPVFILSLIHI